MKTHLADNEAKTAALAAEMAESARIGDVLCLSGPMGAGKSVFARAFIQTLCGGGTEVPSPTFTLIQTYDSPRGPVSHFDLYRIESPEECLALGWDDAMADTISLIEWPERAGSLLPARRTDIVFIPGTDESRTIQLTERP